MAIVCCAYDKQAFVAAFLLVLLVVFLLCLELLQGYVIVSGIWQWATNVAAVGRRIPGESLVGLVGLPKLVMDYCHM